MTASPPWVGLPVEAGLSREQFRGAYYAPGRPVVLTDLSIGGAWSWTPEHLAQVLGRAPVEVMAGRDSDPLYERTLSHRATMAFADYARLVTASAGNDVYMVANNHLLETAPAAPLWADLSPDPRYLLPSSASRRGVFLWLGPAGTVTPLHYDTQNVLFAQVLGRKRFVLVPPWETTKLANAVGVYSDVDAFAPDLVRFPAYAAAARVEFVMEPREALLIPAGWWHAVQSLDPAISVSFTTFVDGNSPISLGGN